ncbi:MAG: OsmY protein [Proteobacteria bacterium]|nr:OsmY protein [Pseudomonadota bacterium]
MKTDLDVQRDVIAELDWEPSVDAAHIGVTVNGGVVTLTGHVASYAEKFDAERAAQRVSGVKAMAVAMDVALPAFSLRTDADIAGAVENVLLWSTHFPRDALKVVVENGWVTLSGNLDWQYQRRAAVASVQHLMGVTGVSDQILIHPESTMGDIKLGIESALKRYAKGDARNINVKVSVKGDEVTLEGHVHNWAERNLALNTAWDAPGVRGVVDKMDIAIL